MKIEHYFKSYKNGNCNWAASVNVNGKIFCIDIMSNNAGSDPTKYYYMGYVGPRNKEPIVFGFSNYMNNVNYILRAIKKYLEGDTSHIIKYSCISTPDNI